MKDGNEKAQDGSSPTNREKTPKKEKIPALKKYTNKCKGVFTMMGMRWKTGESKLVPQEIADTKKFKHAVSLGVLVKK